MKKGCFYLLQTDFYTCFQEISYPALHKRSIYGIVRPQLIGAVAIQRFIGLRG